MKALILIMLTLSVSFSDCTPFYERAKGTETAKVDFEIKVNEHFKIELKSNGTTGYQWKWANKQDVTIIDSTGWKYILDTPVLTGSGGNEIWTFKGIKSGTDTIKMVYLRSWEKNVPPAESKTFIVKVR